MQLKRLNRCYIATLLLSGCATLPLTPVVTDHGAQKKLAVLDVSRVIEDRWEHLQIKGQTRYRIVVSDGHLAIMATGSGGASGLIRRTDINAEKCRFIEWSWRVDQLQSTADLSNKTGDDVAAAIFVLFGDPGFISDPDSVPTLRYVWTTERHNVDDVIDNPYLPGIVRNIVIETGGKRMRRWIKERRDVYKDFKRAFGHSPKEGIGEVAIFTDNDQTNEPVSAYYRDINFDCP